MRSPFETAAFRVGLAMVAVLLFRSGIAAEVAADLPAPARSVPGAGKSATPRSLWLQEITKLIKAGTDETILLPFIANTEGTFNLDPASIAELKALGATPAVLSAMIQHDRELVTGARPLLASSAPAPRQLPKLPPLPKEPPTPSPPASIIVPMEQRVEFGLEPLPSPPPRLISHPPMPSRQPIPLTDTIVMYRGVSRPANLVVVYSPAAQDQE